MTITTLYRVTGITANGIYTEHLTSGRDAHDAMARTLRHDPGLLRITKAKPVSL